MNDRYLYHGTDQKSAQNIIEHGIDMSKSHKGYFGRGFYTATDENFAKNSYADFAKDEDEEEGVVLKFKLSPSANILDLDNPEDFATWKNKNFEQYGHLDNFDEIMRKNNIDGLRDEGSFGGVVIYNPKVLHLEKELKLASYNIALQFLANVTNKKIIIEN